MEFPYGDDHFVVRASPVREDDFRVIGGVITSPNVTATVRVREQLTRAQARLTAAGQVTGSGFWRLNAETGEIDWSPATVAIMGFEGDCGRPTFAEWMPRPEF